MTASKFKLSKYSLDRLVGVHEDLVRVIKHAIEITEVDFVVLEGVRSADRQAVLVKTGASRTLASRHISGHAVDLGACVDNRIAWDWPLYHTIAVAVLKAANKLNVPVVWGGDWKSFPDGPHFELSRKEYP